jgi:hypothetical protein
MKRIALPLYPKRKELCFLWTLSAIAGSLIALCFCSMAVAAPTVRDHLQNVSKTDYQASMNIWLDGAIGALLAGNADLKQTRKVSPLFCLPKGQGISSANAMKLIDQEIGNRRWKDWVPLATVLLDALQRSYPCNQGKR